MILELKLENNWIEAAWKEEDKQIHCESFSGHTEHIAMLEAKAKEFNTSLAEYQELIDTCKTNFIYPTEEELNKENLATKVQEANQYLKDTDWVNSYKIRHDLGLELILEDSSKWEVINKREEYILFLKAIEGVK